MLTQKKEEDKLRDPLGLLQPTTISPQQTQEPLGGLRDPLGLLREAPKVIPFSPVGPTPSPENRAFDQLRGMFTPSPSTKPAVGAVTPPMSDIKMPELEAPHKPVERETTPYVYEPPVRKELSGAAAFNRRVQMTGGQVIAPGPSGPKPSTGNENWDAVADTMGFVMGIVTASFVSPQSAYGHISQMGKAASTSLALKIAPKLGMAIPTVEGLVGTAIRLGGLRGVGAYSEGASDTEALKAAGEGVAAGLILAGVGGPLSAKASEKIGKITEKHVEAALKESFEKGAVAITLSNILRTLGGAIAGGPPSGATIGVMNQFIKYAKDPEAYEKDAAVNEIATSAFFYTMLNLAFSLLDAPKLLVTPTDLRLAEVGSKYMPLDQAFKTLGVKPGTPHKEMREVYRSLSKQYHPDVRGETFGDKTATLAKMQEISRAWNAIGLAGKLGILEHPAVLRMQVDLDTAVYGPPPQRIGTGPAAEVQPAIPPQPIPAAPAAPVMGAPPTTIPTAPVTSPVVPSTAPIQDSWRVGQTIHHDKLGRGQIQAMGESEGAQVLTVAFDEHGTKKIMAAKAPIVPTVVGDVILEEAPAAVAPTPPPGEYRDIYDMDQKKRVPITPAEAQKKIRGAKKVYLAGPIRGVSKAAATEWRLAIAQELSKYGIESLDPMRNQAEKKNPDGTINHAKVVALDKEDMEQMDALVVYAPKASAGTASEVTHTWSLLPEKPIYVIGDPEGEPLSPFVTQHATVIFKSLPDFQAFLTAEITPDVAKQPPEKKPSPIVQEYQKVQKGVMKFDESRDARMERELKEEPDKSTRRKKVEVTQEPAAPVVAEKPDKVEAPKKFDPDRLYKTSAEFEKVKKAWPSFIGPRSMDSAEVEKITTTKQLFQAIRANKKVPFSVVERIPEAVPGLLKALDLGKASIDDAVTEVPIKEEPPPRFEKYDAEETFDRIQKETEELKKPLEAEDASPFRVNSVVQDKQGKLYRVVKLRKDGFVSVINEKGKPRTFKEAKLSLAPEDAPSEGIPLAPEPKPYFQAKVARLKKEEPTKKKLLKPPKSKVTFKLVEGEKKTELTRWDLDTEDVDVLEKVLGFEWTGLSPTLQDMRRKLLRSLGKEPFSKDPGTTTPEEWVNWLFQGEVIEGEPRAELNRAELSRLKAILANLELQQLKEEREVIGPQLTEFDLAMEKLKLSLDQRWEAYEHMEASLRKYWGGNEAKNELKKISDKYEKLKGQIEIKINRMLTKPLEIEKITPSPESVRALANRGPISMDVQLHPDSLRLTLQMLNHVVDSFYEQNEYVEEKTGRLIKVVDPEWFTKTGYVMEALGKDAHLVMSGTTAYSVEQQKEDLAKFYMKVNKLRSQILDAAEKMPPKKYAKIIEGIAVAKKTSPHDIIIKSRVQVGKKDIRISEDDNPFNPIKQAEEYVAELTPTELAKQYGIVNLESDQGSITLQVVKRRHKTTPWVIIDTSTNTIIKYVSTPEAVLRVVKSVSERVSKKPSEESNEAYDALKEGLRQSEEVSLAKDSTHSVTELLKHKQKEALTAEQARRRAELLGYTEKTTEGISPALPRSVRQSLAKRVVPEEGEILDQDLDLPTHPRESIEEEAKSLTHRLADREPTRGEEKLTRTDRKREDTSIEDLDTDNEVFVEELMWPRSVIRKGAHEIVIGEVRELKQGEIINLFNEIPGALEFWETFLDGKRGKVIVPRDLDGAIDDLVKAIGYRYNGHPVAFKVKDKLLTRAEAYYKYFLNPDYNEKEADLRGEKILELLGKIKKTEYQLTEFDFAQEVARRAGTVKETKLKPTWKGVWNRTGGRKLQLKGRTLKSTLAIAQKKKITIEEAKSIADESDAMFHPFQITNSREAALLVDKLDKLFQDRGVEDADRVRMVYGLVSMMEGANEAGINLNLAFRLAPQIERVIEKDLLKIQELVGKEATMGKVAIKKEGKLLNISMELLLSKDEPLVESFIHELAHVWLAVWEASGSKDYGKMKDFLTGQLIQAVGYSNVTGAETAVDGWSNDEMASLLTNYLLSGGHDVDQTLLKAGKVNPLRAWAARFKEWVSQAMEKLKYWRDRVWPGQPQEIKDQADLFAQGNWGEAFKRMGDKPFASTYYMSKGMSLNESLKRWAKLYGKEQELKFPTPFENFSDVQKANITKWQKDTAKLLKSKDLRPEFKKELAAVLDALNWKSLVVSEKTLTTLHHTKQFLKENSDWIMPQSYIDKLDILEKMPLSELSYEQIALVFHRIENLAQQNTLKNHLKRKRMKEKREEGIEASRKVLEKSHKLVVTTDANLTRHVEQAIKNKSLSVPVGITTKQDYISMIKTPELIAQQLQGSMEGPIKKIVLDDVNEGSNRGFAHKFKAEAQVNEKMTQVLGKDFERKIRPWSYMFNLNSKDLELIEHKLPKSGKTIKLSRGDRMAIYLLTKSGDKNLRDLLEAGYFNTWDTKRQVAPHILPKEDIEFIIGQMDAGGQEKEIADYMLKFINANQMDAVNKISYDLESFKLRHEGDHPFWPVSRPRISMKAEEMKLLGSERRQARGLMSRLANELSGIAEEGAAPRAIYLRDAFDTFYKSIMDASHFIATAEPLYNLRALVEDRAFYDDLKAAGLESYHTALEVYADDLVRGIERENEIISMAHKLLNRTRTAILSLQPWVIMKQPASYLLAIEDIELEYLLKAAASKPDWKLIEKYQTPNIRERAQGKINRETGEIGEVGSCLQFFTGNTFVGTKLTKGITWADRQTVGRIFHAAEYKIKAERPDLKGDDLYREVAKLHEAVIHRSQPSYLLHTRSQLGRSRDLWINDFTSFTTQVSKNANFFMRNVWRFQASEKSLKNIVLFITTMFVFFMAQPAFIMGVDELRRWGLRQSPRSWGERVRDYTLLMLNHLPVVGPVARMVFSKAERGAWAGHDISTPLIGTINQIGKAAGSVGEFAWKAITQEEYTAGVRKGQLKAPEAFQRMVDESLLLFGAMRGLPTQNVKHMLEAQLSRLSADTEFTVYTRTRNPQVGYYYNHLWEGVSRGDEKEAERAMRILVKHFSIDADGINTSWKAISKNDENVTTEGRKEALELFRKIYKEEKRR